MFGAIVAAWACSPSARSSCASVNSPVRAGSGAAERGTIPRECAATLPAPSHSSFSFGPGPLSPAIKALIVANVAMFCSCALMPPAWARAAGFLGLIPARS